MKNPATLQRPNPNTTIPARPEWHPIVVQHLPTPVALRPSPQARQPYGHQQPFVQPVHRFRQRVGTKRLENQGRRVALVLLVYVVENHHQQSEISSLNDDPPASRKYL